jgi:hypothetical protein
MEVTLAITNFYDYSPFFHPLLNEHDVKTSFFKFWNLEKKWKKMENREFMDFFHHFLK